MADVAEFDMIGPKELNDHAIRSIDPKTTDFVALRMQFLAVKGWMKRILSEEIGLGGGFALNRLGEFLNSLSKVAVVESSSMIG